MADETSPQLLRHELGARLRELRLSREMTVDDVAGRLLCSASKISRMETGQRGASQRDVRDLCEIYQVEKAATREDLMALAKAVGQRRSRWHLGEGCGDPAYLDLESTAATITICVAGILPALFQTEDYARAQLRGSFPDADAKWIEQRLYAYEIRQRTLTRKDPPQVLALIDEAALHRQVGGEAVMRAQLDRLIRLNALPNVDIRIVPFSAGVHEATDTMFTLLEFERDLVSSIVFFEELSGNKSSNRPGDVARYQRAIRRLRDAALDSTESGQIVAEMRDGSPGRSSSVGRASS